MYRQIYDKQKYGQKKKSKYKKLKRKKVISSFSFSYYLVGIVGTVGAVCDTGAVGTRAFVSIVSTILL